MINGFIFLGPIVLVFGILSGMPSLRSYSLAAVVIAGVTWLTYSSYIASIADPTERQGILVAQIVVVVIAYVGVTVGFAQGWRWLRRRLRKEEHYAIALMLSVVLPAFGLWLGVKIVL